MTGTGSIITSQRDARAAHLRELVARANGKAAWLGERRQAAFERFAALGFPTVRDEAWRHTDVGPIANRQFATAPEAAPVGADAVDAAALPYVAGPRLVLRNGRFAEDLSSLAGLPRGVFAGSLAEALRTGHPALERSLGLQAPWEDHAFTALNTALFEDGVFVHLDPGARLEAPLQIIALAGGSDPFEIHPRILIVAGEGSEALVAESWSGTGAAFTNAVTEIVVGPGAVVTHCRVQGDARQAHHVARTRAVLGRDARFESVVLALGAALSRNEVDAVFQAEGGDCSLNGLYLGDGRQHTDNQTFVDHAQPHCTSGQLYKGILSGEAHGVFNGRVIVRPKAQKTNAHQKNRNLLLSEAALADTKPQLEIYADDVRCTHGATIGRLDAEKIFYLRSRGVALRAAEEILTQAFAREVVAGLRSEPVRVALEGWIGARLVALTGGAA